MRTTKPIATISYNSPEFLRLKLRELLSAGRISFWAFIVHQPEDDEGGKKQHCHLYVEPSKMLQTDDLKSELKEFDPTHPDKPKGCISWVSSKFDPWYLYGLHDARYLASKGQSRRFHYSHDDFITSDDDDLLCKARSIDLIALSPYADMLDAQAHGISWQEYFSRGTVPLPQIALFERAWILLSQAKTNRNGRQGHEPEVDESTGEVVESSPVASESPEKAPQSPETPTWCGATRSEWQELYESASSDSEQGLHLVELDSEQGLHLVELDPEEELPF